MSRTRWSQDVGVAVLTCTLFLAQGCQPPSPGGGDNQDNQNDNGGGGPVYNNTTDRTNRNATFLGSEACRACHPDMDVQQSIHGHAHKLTRIQGEPPEFPEEGTRAGVPNPPEGFEWSDISYVIGGYTKKARFIDEDGYILTSGLTGVNTQWNLDFPATGTEAGFAPYEGEATDPKPYGYSCFVCHTTGPLPQDEDFPEFQENRPGFIGTWQEAGIQCEACHGPGSNHVPNPPARDIFVDASAKFCGECHNRPFNSDGSVILAQGGFIQHHEQYPELLASGGHANLDCTTCHDPHISVLYDRENALRRECRDCHQDMNMALHSGKVYVRLDYVEELSCESCHMPLATKSATAASETVVGPLAHVGDTRTHIFRINTAEVDQTAFFSADGSQVRKDSQGRAAVTVDFVCLRCHNGMGGAFELTLDSASSIAEDMHSAGM